METTGYANDSDRLKTGALHVGKHRSFAKDTAPMKIDELKVALAKQILDTESEAQLRSVDLIMNHGTRFELSDTQKSALDTDRVRYLRGEGKTYSEDADADIAEAMRWYRQQRIGLEERFLEEVEACVAKAVEFPKRFRVVYKRFRQAPLDGFPFVIIYEVIEEDMVVFRVFHTSRDPKKKFKRKK
jgi:plasmid stabilization system protein ParE